MKLHDTVLHTEEEYAKMSLVDLFGEKSNIVNNINAIQIIQREDSNPDLEKQRIELAMQREKVLTVIQRRLYAGELP